MSTMTVSFPGGKRVDAEYGGFTIRTDQPPQGGGEGSAPPPFDLFLASIGGEGSAPPPFEPIVLLNR